MKAQVTAKNGLYIREKASQKSEPVGVLPNNAIVEFTQRRKEWLKVNDGWIMKEFTVELEEEISEVEISEEEPAE